MKSRPYLIRAVNFARPSLRRDRPTVPSVARQLGTER